MNKIKFHKNIFLLLLIISCSLESYSQLKSNMGFTAGISVSQLSGDNDKYNRNIYRKGVYGGVFWDIYLEYQNTIEVGGFYTQQGGIQKLEYYDIRGKKVEYSVSNQIDYVMFPVIWKQQWGDLFTQIGMYGEVAINAKSLWKREYFYLDSTSYISGNYKSFTHDLRLYDFGGFFGVGYQKPVTDNYDFFINISYRFGFFSIENMPENSGELMKNRIFTLNTGIILFNKNKRYAIKRKN